MTLAELITPSSVLCDLEGTSKKRILEIASQIIAEHHNHLEADDVFAGLINREKLGSTGIGDGVAIPHCRLSNCSSPIGYLIKLSNPIDFDSIDSQPVDLIFILAVPEEACQEHLNILGSIAENMGREEFRQQLRQAESAEAMYQAVSDNAL